MATCSIEASPRASPRPISSAPPRRPPRRIRGRSILPPFRELPDEQLNRLDDGELVSYISRARGEGRDEAATRAAQILAFAYSRRVEGFVANKLGSRGPLVVEEVAARTISDAIASAAGLAGESIEEFRGWLFRIARRRMADYLRTGRVREEPMQIEWGDGEPIEREGETPDATIAVELASVWNQAYSGLSEVHREVVLSVRLRGLSHREVAEHINGHLGERLDDPMSEDNVAKINSRFGKELDRLLEAADDPSHEEPDDD